MSSFPMQAHTLVLPTSNVQRLLLLLWAALHTHELHGDSLPPGPSHTQY